MTLVTIGDNTGDDFSGTEDTELTEITPVANSGAGAAFYFSLFQAGDRRCPVLRLTGISNLPSELTVNSASLHLYQIDNGGGSGDTMQLKRLLRDWVEGEATWNIWKTSNSWATAGGLSDGSDRIATVSASRLSDTTNGAYKTWTGAQLAQDVEDFASGAAANHGWHGGFANEINYGTSRYWQFRSSDGTDGQRPYLEVDYTEAGAATVVPVFLHHLRQQGIA